jgi:hypothetical protein
MNQQDALNEIKKANNEERSADLRSADLRSADLRSANLRSANLCYANLCYADLCSADLRSANLRSADLRSANLCSADLCSADLCSANLCYANLRSADLTDVKLPAPTMVLLANWGNCSDELTVDLMRYDASNHIDPYAFDRWAKSGVCPYKDCHVQRAANFTEKKELWTSWNPRKKVKSAYELMTRLIAEHCKTEENSHD